jgi:pimeloyl-ACP methyl ester carboxylesterase
MDPIVFIHGLAAGKSFFEPIQGFLEPEFETYAFDLLGFGNNKNLKSDFSLDSHLRFISQKISEKYGNRKVVLSGHSMGAVLAIYFAKKFPEKVSKLVLLNPVLGRDREDIINGFHAQKGLSWAKLILEHKNFSFVSCKLLCKSKGMFLFYPLKPPYVSAHMFYDYTEHTWESLYKTYENIVLNSPAFPILENLTLSTLNISGLDDGELSSRKPIRPNIQNVSLPGGHYLPIQYPEAVAGAIKEFIKN